MNACWWAELILGYFIPTSVLRAWHKCQFSPIKIAGHLFHERFTFFRYSIFFVVLLDSIFEKPRGLVPQNTFWIFENCDKLNFILRTLKRSLAWLKCSHYVNFVRSNTLSPFSGKFFCLPHSTSNALEKYRYRNKQSEILDADKRKTEIKHQPISEWGGTRPAPDIKAVTTIPNEPAGTCWFIASSNQCKIGLGDSNYVVQNSLKGGALQHSYGQYLYFLLSCFLAVLDIFQNSRCYS